jgi:hypothetical protein
MKAAARDRQAHIFYVHSRTWRTYLCYTYHSMHAVLTAIRIAAQAARLSPAIITPSLPDLRDPPRLTGLPTRNDSNDERPERG